MKEKDGAKVISKNDAAKRGVSQPAQPLTNDPASRFA